MRSMIFSLFFIFSASVLTCSESEVLNSCLSAMFKGEGEKMIEENPKIKLLISADEISKKIKETAKVLNQEYAGQEIVLVMIMKGAMMFVADLARQLQPPLIIEAIKCTSYRGGTERGELVVSGLDHLDLKGKNVLVVDDIFDSGVTLSAVTKAIKEKEPKSLKSLLLLKKKREYVTNVLPDWHLFEIEDRFVVGYGLDYREYFRNLPAIYAVMK